MELGRLEREQPAGDHMDQGGDQGGTRVSEPRKDGAVVADLRRGDLV